MTTAAFLVHRYGPHIFHTNALDFRIPGALHGMAAVSAPRACQRGRAARAHGRINLDTINRLYGMNLTSSQVESFLESVAEKRNPVRNSEDVVVNKVGRELYEKFFRGYTRKMWGMDPSELNSSVAARIPTRTNRDDRYFTDTYQAMPALGYTRMFERMLQHPNIKVIAEYGLPRSG